MEGQRLVEELYKLIQTIDPATWRADLETAARSHLDTIRKQIARLRAAPLADEGLSASLSDLGAVIETHQRDWPALFQGLQPAYESIAARLRRAHVQAPKLRQSNTRRSSLHVASGLVALAVLTFTPMWLVLAVSSVFLVFAAFTESVRRVSPSFNDKVMSVFAPVAHPHEYHSINSATWYTIAMFLLALSGDLLAASLAVVILGFSDPAAAFIGRRFGRIKIRGGGGRTVAGSTAFVLVGTVVSMVVMAALFPAVPVGVAITLGFTASFAAALAELFSPNVLDDNLTIPLTVGLVVVLLGGVLL